MHTTFPVELIDLFFSVCDKPSLSSCSLVCRTWLPIARYHLLSTSTISVTDAESDRKTLETLLTLLSSPLCTLAPYIRHLLFKGSCPAFPLKLETKTIKTMRTLPHVRSVTFQDVAWTLVPAELTELVTSFDLTKLAFSFVVFPSLDELKCYLEKFPNLKELDVGSNVVYLQCGSSSSSVGVMSTTTDCSDESGKSQRSGPHLKRVRRLAIDASRGHLMSLLFYQPPYSSTASTAIDALELHNLSMPDMSIVDEFLGLTNPRELTLDFRTSRYNISIPNLGSLLHLRSLTINGLLYSRHNTPTKALVSLLSTIKSCLLQSLILSLDNPTFSSIDSWWKSLDDVLAQDQFKHLKLVEFRICSVDKKRCQNENGVLTTTAEVVEKQVLGERLPRVLGRAVLDLVYI
ncbi:hypothetical protein M378DRAFT_15753 [Amanita muscaria Koide BX008]|uniref:F-box domain-containing protein n=1 Tax=Amanita muscaria (strain Koide BX008) TaxID=946122 RepID=A0A0C2WAB2_AMAMK|nr:hypothetical protein M378DRAFT_15753 [Amanita muscaria Koide BX008]